MRKELKKVAEVIRNLYDMNVLKQDQVQTSFGKRKKDTSHWQGAVLVVSGSKEVEVMTITITASNDVLDICSKLLVDLKNDEKMDIIQYLYSDKAKLIVEVMSH